ncbi:ankyrin repeat and protein kinase domain-containing protein 1-like [Schistocerca piceifrons]|uniref:ankyrin repeat and protein kinase domain-containing protein 1-like n=1 Tax=Schistocerca piceifrons TaxID=274613 RepID=UPI001F5F6AD2|nr:ankyrin repeat and protein kinase domain-containing protein 1-like [Schistocerca piceifrons]
MTVWKIMVTSRGRTGRRQVYDRYDRPRVFLYCHPVAAGACTVLRVAKQITSRRLSFLAPRPATPTPTTAACHTPPPEADAVSSMGNLSAEEKSRRLIQVAEEGAVEELMALLAVGADVLARGGEGETCLHRAARRGQVEAARRLLENGAEVDSRNSRQSTPLHLAAESGHAAVVRLLLSSAADPNARNQYEKTPLHYAAQYGHTDVVRLLLTSSPYHNARNQNGWTPLHLAAYSGHTAAAIVLLEAGADRGARNNSGNTPLDIARQNDRQQLLDLLR